MKYWIVLSTLLATFAFMTATAAPLGGGVPAAVHYIDHDTVTSTMAKGGPIVKDPGFVILANRKAATPIEYHEHTNHVFIMVEGEATFITGGKMVNPRETGPGQMTADSIEGGEVHHLSKGDVITIPAKTPHWWKEVTSGTVAYYAVNIEN